MQARATIVFARPVERGYPIEPGPLALMSAAPNAGLPWFADKVVARWVNPFAAKDRLWARSLDSSQEAKEKSWPYGFGMKDLPRWGGPFVRLFNRR